MRKLRVFLVMVLFITLTGFSNSQKNDDEFSITQLYDYQKKYKGEEIESCSDSSVKTYMDYKAVTSVLSKQYKYIHNVMTIDKTSGLLYDEDGFIGAALGSYYGVIGDRYYFTLDNGVVLPIVKVEEKADGDTIDGCFHSWDNSVIEFVIDGTYAREYFGVYANGLILQGNFNNYDLFKGKIVKVEKVLDELNDEFIVYVDKAVMDYSDQDIFQYASGY